MNLEGDGDRTFFQVHFHLGLVIQTGARERRVLRPDYRGRPPRPERNGR